MFIIHKNRNKISIQPILKSNFTSFMFYNIFSGMNGKIVIHWGDGGTVLISSWKCNYSIYLDIQAISTLLCLLLVLYVLFPSIRLLFYLTTALLKSDIFRHSKADSSHSFQPTGLGLGPL